MLADIDIAYALLKSNAASKGYSSNAYALIGESAGGHLALIYALRSSDTDLRTLISFYGPTLMDDEEFKVNANNAPYTTFSVSSIFALQDRALPCGMRETGSMNIAWALNTITGTILSSGITHPEYTDTLSPAYLPNIERNLPVFLMHGLNDNLVPHGHADSLLVSLNTKFGTIPPAENDFTAQHKLKKYTNCGHGWSGGGCNKSVIRSDVIKWLSEHL